MRELAATNCQPLIHTTEEAVMELTQSYLKSILHYDPETGIFIWLNTGSGKRASMDAGYLDIDGYIRITIKGRLYLAHRLAFLYMDGSIPESNVDHCNGDRSDNRYCNIRRADYIENGRNRKRNANNASGVTGVHWNKARNKWHSVIVVGLKSVFLGSHNDFFESVCARKSAERKYEFHYNHDRT